MSTCADRGRCRQRGSSELAHVAERHRLARLTRHGEIIAQRAVPTLLMGRARVALPPGAFLQPTAAGEAALAKLVAEACGERAPIADLFAGIGPFALRLAERARVTAADSDEDAIAALKRAAATTPRAQTGRGANARPVSSAIHARRAEALRLRRIRPAAPGRAGAGARACRLSRADDRRSLVQSQRHLRAMRAFSSTAATG